MAEKPQIFVSSTSEFEPQRAALAKALPSAFEVFFYEQERARGTSPKRFCERKIRASDVFIGILGEAPGSPLPDDEDGRTIVQWEFDLADSVEGLERMVFVHGSVDDEVEDPGQRAFLARVTDFESGLWCDRFDTATELIEQVRSALTGWLAERWSLLRERQTEVLGWLTRRVVAVVGAGVAIALACLLPPVQERLTTSSIVAILLTVFVAALAAVLILRREQITS